jgi:alpha-glucosidase
MSWWEKAVFYHIYPRSFKDSNGDGIGDLPGIISKLDYLNDGTPNSLGIDAIWFSPFFKSPQHDFGYDVADYCAIDPSYGSMDDFDRLVKEAHRRNIRIMLDLVMNHTSCEHPWFKESRSSRDNPKRDWYIWRDGKGLWNRPPNNWRTNFFGPAWEWDKQTNQYYLHLFLKEQPDVNWFNPDVKKAMFDMTRFWLDRGVDGFRLDVAHAYCKDEQLRSNPLFFKRKKIKHRLPWSDFSLPVKLYFAFGLPEFQVKKYTMHHPNTHRILKEFRQVLDAYSDKTSVGEVTSDDLSEILAYYGSGDDKELHMNFNFNLTFCRFSAGAFRRCVEKWDQLLPEEDWPAYALSNHDQVRAISRHDKKGQSDQRARVLAMMLLTLRGAPFIYYGEEIGMKNLKIPKNLLKDPVGIKWYPLPVGRDGERTPMQWSGETGGGFSSGKPWLPIGPEIEERNVVVQEKDPNSLLNFYKKIIWLRKKTPALQSGSFHSILDGVPKDCFVYRRELENQKLIVALNFSSRAQKVDLYSNKTSFDILISTDPERKRDSQAFPLALEPFEGCLLKMKA